MKKCFFYAGALAMLLSSCSNDDVPTGPVQSGAPGGVVKDLKISVTSDGLSKTGRVSTGVGAENTLHDSYVFIKQDADGPNNSGAYEYKYEYHKLEKGKQSVTVQYVEQGSSVYVLSNCDYLDDAAAKLLVEAANKTNGSHVGDRAFRVISPRIKKPYISGLNENDGKFMMSGKAEVPTTSGTAATALSIPLSRDLAKVEFSVKKAATNGTADGSLRVKAVKNITIRRSAHTVEPFAFVGGNPTTYVLPFGFGSTSYVQDGLMDNGSFAPNNIAEVTVGGVASTDYSFTYNWNNQENSDVFNFGNFYVLPNAASTADKGTIIVLQAEIEKCNAQGTWEAVTGDKYYKARLSSGIDAFATGKNAQYKIVASIKGEGNSNNSGDTGPDVENTEHDLNISVQVQPWSLIVSNQEVE